MGFEAPIVSDVGERYASPRIENGSETAVYTESETKPEMNPLASAIVHGDRPPSVPSDRPIQRRDVGCVVLLAVLIAAAWSIANGKISSHQWALPITYTDPTYSDFLGTAGLLHSLRGGATLPLALKKATDLGAPDSVNWSAVFLPDKLLIGLFCFHTRFFGTFSGFNIGLIVGHIAAGATCYVACRTWLGAERCWCFVAGLAFGLAPYLFAESPHHINCQYAWHLPFFPIVWTWVASEPGLQRGSRKFWQAVGIAIITGLQNPYYTFVFCQLAILGVAVIAWRRRSWAVLWPTLIVAAAAAGGFLINNCDTLLYRVLDGNNAAPLVAQREYRWMDIYGFKIVDLFIPSFTHHSPALANFGLAHRQASALNDEEGCAYLGLLGIGCLLFLVISTVRALLDGKLAAVPLQAWWILWIVLFFNTGGLNSLIASYTGFTLFRTATRYSVVVLVIVLLYAAQRLSAWQRDAASRYPADVLKIGTLTAAVAASLLLLWDQVPRGPTAENTALIATLVDSDRAFVDRLEQALPERAMIFQLPVMDGTPVPGVATHDHYRPYLYSTRLHWSHGALPGSKTLQWQQSVQKQLVEGAAVDQQAQRVRFDIGNVRRAVDEMTRRGFVAIYLNRNGFPDRGKGLIDALLELGFNAPPIYSAAGDLTCILLGDRPTAAK